MNIIYQTHMQYTIIIPISILTQYPITIHCQALYNCTISIIIQYQLIILYRINITIPILIQRPIIIQYQ